MSVNNHNPIYCIVCNEWFQAVNSTRTISFRGGRGGVFHDCSQCNSLIPEHTADSKALYDERDSTNFSAGKGVLFSMKTLALMWQIQGILKMQKPKKVLDYGCGGGELANAIKKSGIDYVHACDLQGRAPDGLHKEITYSSIETLPNGFDLAFVRHVIEHVPDPGATISEIASKIVPGGCIIVETPDPDSAWRSIFKGRWPGYFYPYHTAILSEKGISDIAKKNGIVLECTKKAEPPIFGLVALQCGLPRTVARLISLSLYPLQILVSLVNRKAEAKIYYLKV